MNDPVEAKNRINSQLHTRDRHGRSTQILGATVLPLPPMTWVRFSSAPLGFMAPNPQIPLDAFSLVLCCDSALVRKHPTVRSYRIARALN